jgi:hypothetical protein
LFFEDNVAKVNAYMYDIGSKNHEEQCLKTAQEERTKAEAAKRSVALKKKISDITPRQSEATCGWMACRL